MATYNGARFITEQLDSIRLQSLPVDQVILRMTVPRIRRWRSYGNIWRLTSWHRHGGSHRTENDWGMQENFRAAVEETDGEYVFFCDQDDIWEPDRVNIW